MRPSFSLTLYVALSWSKVPSILLAWIEKRDDLILSRIMYVSQPSQGPGTRNGKPFWPRGEHTGSCRDSNLGISWRLEGYESRGYKWNCLGREHNVRQEWEPWMVLEQYHLVTRWAPERTRRKAKTRRKNTIAHCIGESVIQNNSTLLNAAEELSKGEMSVRPSCTETLVRNISVQWWGWKPGVGEVWAPGEEPKIANMIEEKFVCEREERTGWQMKGTQDLERCLSQF